MTICDKLDEIRNDLGAPDMDNVETKLDRIDSRLNDIRDGINDLEGTTREILGASIFN